jgi:hypothetical protein
MGMGLLPWPPERKIVMAPEDGIEGRPLTD